VWTEAILKPEGAKLIEICPNNDSTDLFLVQEEILKRSRRMSRLNMPRSIRGTAWYSPRTRAGADKGRFRKPAGEGHYFTTGHLDLTRPIFLHEEKIGCYRYSAISISFAPSASIWLSVPHWSFCSPSLRRQCCFPGSSGPSRSR